MANLNKIDFQKTHGKLSENLSFHRSPPLNLASKNLANARPNLHGGRVGLVDIDRNIIPLSKGLKNRVVSTGSSPLVTGSPLMEEGKGKGRCAPRIQDNVELNIGELGIKAVDFRLLPMGEDAILKMGEFAWINDLPEEGSEAKRAFRDAKIAINKRNTDKVWADYTTAKDEMEFGCRVEENLTIRIQALRWIVKEGVSGAESPYTLDRLLAIMREDAHTPPERLPVCRRQAYQGFCNDLQEVFWNPGTKDMSDGDLRNWVDDKISSFTGDADHARQKIIAIKAGFGKEDSSRLGGYSAEKSFTDKKGQNNGEEWFPMAKKVPKTFIGKNGLYPYILGNPPQEDSPDMQLLVVRTLLRGSELANNTEDEVGFDRNIMSQKACGLGMYQDESMQAKDSFVGVLLRFAARDRLYGAIKVPAPFAAKAALARHDFGLPVSGEHSLLEPETPTGLQKRHQVEQAQQDIYSNLDVGTFATVRNASFQSLIDSGYAGDCKSMGLAISVALEGSTALSIKRDHELAVILVEEGMAQGMMYDKGFRDTMQVLARKNLHLFSFRSNNPFHNVYAKVAGRVHSLRDTKSKRAEDWGRMHTTLY